MISYLVERCEVCGGSDIRQSVPPVIKAIRQPDGSAPRYSCCAKCATAVDNNNRPYEEIEQKADEAAKAVMDAKLAAIKKEEEDKKAKEGQVLEMLVQQNQMMFASMQQTQQLLAALLQKDEPTRPRRTRAKRQEVQSQE